LWTTEDIFTKIFDTFNAVIKEADRASYAAKQRKINGSVCMYSQVLSSEKEMSIP